MTGDQAAHALFPRIEGADHLLGRTGRSERLPGTKPRLVWIEATEARPGLNRMWDFLGEYLVGLSGDAFETSIVAFPLSAGGARHPAARVLSEGLVLAAAAEVEAPADIVLVNDWTPPVRQLRALLDPVTALSEASVVLGSVIAQRPAIVTVAEELRDGLVRDLGDIGLLGRMADPPVWGLDPPSTHEDVQDAIDHPDGLIGRFDAVARRAVDAGADAILVGCGYYGPVFVKHGYTHVSGHPDVPVYDCVRLGFEMARVLYALREAGIDPSPRAFPRLAEPSATAARRMMARILAAAELGPGRWRSSPR